ncbi:MAG: hypothetical protein M1829_000564 [Trizodia sp. TS-e1964]|nr:MAG: hypothetical protein M1829_000564 [Trizodia sp. TS-e1964]
MAEGKKAFIPAKRVLTDYPLIDSDPHFRRVLKYARPSDYASGLAYTALGPALMLAWEKFAPSYVSRGGFPPIMRLTAAVSASAGFLIFYQNSALRFYGFTENKREVEMDMREMVDKVKRGEKLYGESSLTPYTQGMASRNSRYTALWLHMIPWFNFVNHDQASVLSLLRMWTALQCSKKEASNPHGVDTAKYYQQAERELEAEKSHDKPLQ